MMRASEEGFEPAVPLLGGPVLTGVVVLVAVLVLGMLVLFGWLLTRDVRRVRRSDAQVAAAQPRVGAAPAAPSTTAAPLEQRLLELDDLHHRGVITDAERQEARQRVLSGS